MMFFHINVCTCLSVIEVSASAYVHLVQYSPLLSTCISQKLGETVRVGPFPICWMVKLLGWSSEEWLVLWECPSGSRMTGTFWLTLGHPPSEWTNSNLLGDLAIVLPPLVTFTSSLVDFSKDVVPLFGLMHLSIEGEWRTSCTTDPHAVGTTQIYVWLSWPPCGPQVVFHLSSI